ncbi:MAG TPA: hypothetical protein VNU24_01075, partial [Solirubrobacteraceae bacterium]|nr:hypothetical protein [Solirubrobacteraceae bacterium]
VSQEDLPVGVGRGAESGLRSRTKATARRLMVLVKRLRPLDALALAAVCVAVAAPLTYTLHERHSVGPTGYEIWDVDDYATEPDAMEQQSIRQATDSYSLAVVDYVKGAGNRSLHPSLRSTNFDRIFWTIYGGSYQNIDASPLSANLNEVIGLHGTDTQTLFLIVFLLAGALGAFAAVRYFAPSPRWAAPLAGILFAGPFFLQLMADGSQAATCGLGLVLPIAAVGMDTLRQARWASLAVLALLIAGLSALYPLFVPGIAISGALALLVLGVVRARKGQLDRRTLRRAAGAVSFVIVLSILFDVVVFTRNVRYWNEVLKGKDYFSTLPQYHLPFSILPGWLFQTREFYSLTNLGNASAWQLLIGVALPVAVVIAMLLATGLKRVAAIVLLPISVYALMAFYTSAAHGCSYCTERAMLPIAPLSIGLFALGVAALASTQRAWLRWAGIALAAILVLAVAERTRQERLRFSQGSYFLDSESRDLISHLPAKPGAVDIEGYGEDSGTAVGEAPLIYAMVAERTHGDVSIATEYNDYNALAYVGAANPHNPQFDPNYRYVLTRLGGVKTGRRVIARSGSLALEERAGQLDVTLVSGIGVPMVRVDKNGLPWVEAPLHMLVVGGGRAPAWVSVSFKPVVRASVVPQPGLKVAELGGGEFAACIPATGTAPLRTATIGLSFPLLPGVLPAEKFGEEGPPRGVQIQSMYAAASCSLAPT